MQILGESVGLGMHRTLKRNRVALEGSLFIGTARCEDKLIGLVRLVGDGAYILHLAELIVHPDFQNIGIGRKLMELAINFAKDKKIGTGDNLGEFTLFADIESDTFYKKLGFILTPNGMVLTDTEARKKYELDFQKNFTKNS